MIRSLNFVPILKIVGLSIRPGLRGQVYQGQGLVEVAEMIDPSLGDDEQGAPVPTR